MGAFDELIVLAIEEQDLSILQILMDKYEEVDQTLDHGTLSMKLKHRVDWECMESEFLSGVLRLIDELFRVTGGYNDDGEYSIWVQFGVWDRLFEKIVSVDKNGVDSAYVLERMGVEHNPVTVIENVISESIYIFDDVDVIIRNVYNALISFKNVSAENVNNELFNVMFNAKRGGDDEEFEFCVRVVLRLIEKHKVDFSNVDVYALKTALHVESSELVYALIENGVSLSHMKDIREIGVADQWQWLDQVELVSEVEQLVPIFKIFETAGIDDVTIYRHLYSDARCIRAAVSGVASSIEDLERYYSSSGVTTSEEWRF